MYIVWMFATFVVYRCSALVGQYGGLEEPRHIGEKLISNKKELRRGVSRDLHKVVSGTLHDLPLARSSKKCAKKAKAKSKQFKLEYYANGLKVPKCEIFHLFDFNDF